MNHPARQILTSLASTGRGLLPVLLVIALFQWGVIGGGPPEAGWLLLALLALAIGISLILKAMDLVIFPLGAHISGEMAARGSPSLTVFFGFCLGFGAVIAEPSLAAVAGEAHTLTNGAITAGMFRLVVALSVGAAVALGILRSLLGHAIHGYLIGVYGLLMLVTLLTPDAITSLAMDAGAVSVNIVTVPLLVALGTGLSSVLRHRSALAEGFGLLALAVAAPRIGVQLYGTLALGETSLAPGGAYQVANSLVENSGPWADLALVARSILPVLCIILFFQFVILRRRLAHPRQLVAGGLLLFAGLFLFSLGIKHGLFPIGQTMALELVEVGLLWLLLFVFLVGLTATLVEPALMAITQRAQSLAPGQVHARLLRHLAALGVALGLVLGVLRLLADWPMEYLLAVLLPLMGLLIFLAPRELVGLAFDLGGVATSDVTVPLITAFGIALSTLFGQHDPLLAAFGMIALASLGPIMMVLCYATAIRFLLKSP